MPRFVEKQQARNPWRCSMPGLRIFKRRTRSLLVVKALRPSVNNDSGASFCVWLNFLAPLCGYFRVAAPAINSTSFVGDERP